jgi:hypothetical protein
MSISIHSGQTEGGLPGECGLFFGGGRGDNLDLLQLQRTEQVRPARLERRALVKRQLEGQAVVAARRDPLLQRACESEWSLAALGRARATGP